GKAQRDEVHATLFHVKLDRSQLDELLRRDRVEARGVPGDEVAMLLLSEGDHLPDMQELELELADQRGKPIGRLGEAHREGSRERPSCPAAKGVNSGASLPLSEGTHPGARRQTEAAAIWTRPEFTGRESTHRRPPAQSGNP